MNSNVSHPLLAQIPLTVSPFVSLPTATTLPYTYTPLPSTLPPALAEKYLVSKSGQRADAQDIKNSCTALKDYMQQRKDTSEARVKEWRGAMEQRDLAEKRRVAPGWLDSEERLLQPQKVDVSALDEAFGRM